MGGAPPGRARLDFTREVQAWEPLRAAGLSAGAGVFPEGNPAAVTATGRAGADAGLGPWKLDCMPDVGSDPFGLRRSASLERR